MRENEKRGTTMMSRKRLLLVFVGLITAGGLLFTEIGSGIDPARGGGRGGGGRGGGGGFRGAAVGGGAAYRGGSWGGGGRGYYGGGRGYGYCGGRGFGYGRGYGSRGFWCAVGVWVG